MNPRIHRRLAAACLTGLTLSPFLLLSAEPPERDKEEDEVIVLSPFTVNSVGATGYTATSTLAGSRLGATGGGA